MPLRWKIFRAFNIVQLIYFIGVLGFFAIILARYPVVGEGTVYLYLLMLGFLFVILNCILNLHILNKYFPDKLFPNETKSLHIISSILYGITILILFGFSFVQYIRLTEGYYRPRGITMILVFVLMTVSGIYILIQQAFITTYLDRNAKSEIDRLFEDFGKPEDQE